MNIKPVNHHLFLRMKMASDTIVLPESSKEMSPIAIVIEASDDVTVCKKGDTVLFQPSPSVVRVPEAQFGPWAMFAMEKDIVAVLTEETPALPAE